MFEAGQRSAALLNEKSPETQSPPSLLSVSGLWDSITSPGLTFTLTSSFFSLILWPILSLHDKASLLSLQSTDQMFYQTGNSVGLQLTVVNGGSNTSEPLFSAWLPLALFHIFLFISVWHPLISLLLTSPAWGPWVQNHVASSITSPEPDTYHFAFILCSLSVFLSPLYLKLSAGKQFFFFLFSHEARFIFLG